MEKTLERVLAELVFDLEDNYDKWIHATKGIFKYRTQKYKFINQSRKKIRTLLKAKMPKKKEFGSDYDRGSNCDLNYINGYNKTISEMQKVIEEL